MRTLPLTSNYDLLLEIETPELRVTFEDFSIAEDREKAGGKFAEINRGKYRRNFISKLISWS